MRKTLVVLTVISLTALSCDMPVEEIDIPPDTPDTQPADFTIPNAEVTAANAAELARYAAEGYTYIGYDGDVDAVFAIPDGRYYLILNNGSITTENNIDAPRVTIYAKGDFFIPKDKSVNCANLCVNGNITIEGALSCSVFILSKGSIAYSGSLLESYMIGVNGTITADTGLSTIAPLIIGGDFSVRDNITANGIWVLGNAEIDGGKTLTATGGEIIIEKDLIIHGNGVEGGCVVSGNEELIVNGNIYIDENSVEKIKNATLPPVIRLGNKHIGQLSEILETLNKAAGFSKLNLILPENDVLTEKIIAPEKSNITISNKVNYTRGLTIGTDGELVITGDTRVVFDTNVSVSGKLNVGQGGIAELGKNRELEIIDKGLLTMTDNLLRPENKTVVNRAALRSGGSTGMLVFDGGGINLFFSDETGYGEMELRNGGGISITGLGGVNLYGGDTACEKNMRLYGSGAVFGVTVVKDSVLLQATAEGGMIEIPVAAGSGAVFTVNGAGIIDLGAEHTNKDGILLGGEGKGTLRLLNGAYIGSASTPVITAGGGSITQIGTLSPATNTDFSAAGTFAQTTYDNGGGVDIQNITTGYGSISTAIDTNP